MPDDQLIFPTSTTREQLESLLRDEEDLRFKLTAMSHDAAARMNVFDFDSTIEEEGEDELLSLATFEKTTTSSAQSVLLREFEEFGGKPVAAAVLHLEGHPIYVIAYRGTPPEFPQNHGDSTPELPAVSTTPAPVPAHAHEIFGSARSGIFGGLPWGNAKPEMMRLEGLFSPVHVFRNPSGKILAFLIVSDADIDTDGPGGSKQKDPSWQPETSLRHRNGQACNSREFPGVVRTVRFREEYGLKLGDFALVCHDGKVQACQVYDQGPRDKIGEISLFAARQLGGVPPSMDERTAARSGNFTRQLVTLFFPGSSDDNRARNSIAEIEADTLRCFETLTGRSFEEDQQVPTVPRVLLPAATATPQPAIFSREDWRARAPRRTRFGTEKAEGIVVHNTEDPNRAPLDGEAEIRKAFALSRNIQNFHMDKRRWDDVGQHFTISRGGIIMEGRKGSFEAARRGEVVQAAHAGSSVHNRRWFGIELEGNFNRSLEITEPQREALFSLCAWLLGEARLSADMIIGHKDVRDTTCPGTLLAELPQIRREVSLRMRQTGLA